MPNWCENKMVATGTPERIQEFDIAFKGYPAAWCCAEPKAPVYCLNALYPVPEEIIKIGYSFKKRNAEEEELFEKHKMNGYEWCYKHWSIKWDCEIEQVSISAGCAEYALDSPWVPPYLWALEVSRRWPDLQIKQAYFEPGMGFAGLFVCENGEMIEEEEYTHLDDSYKYFVSDNFGWDESSDEEAG